MAANILADLVHELDRHVVARCVLHALGADQPQRVLLRVHAHLADGAIPDLVHVAPVWQCCIFSELFVPPVNALFVQPVFQFFSDAHQAFLVRQLVTQSLLDHRRMQVPVVLAERHDEESVLLEPVEAVDFLTVRIFRRRRLAGAVPDFVDFVNGVSFQRVIVVLALQRHATGAAVDRGVVTLGEASTTREFRCYPGEVARFAAGLDGRLA